MTTTAERPGYLILLPWSIDCIGGVNTVVRQLLLGLKSDRKYSPLLLVSDFNAKQLHVDTLSQPFTICSLRLRSPLDRRHPLKNAFSFLLEAPLTLWRLATLLRKERITVCNPHYPGLQLFLPALLKRFGIYRGRLILSFHGTDLADMKASAGLERWLWRRLLRNCDSFALCSSDLCTELVAAFPETAERIHIIYNGITALAAEERKILPPLPGRLKSRPFLLNIGAFRKIKGQDLLLRAFARLDHTLFPQLLVLVGSGGEKKSALTELACELGIKERVIFLEDLSPAEVTSLLLASDCLVIASRREAFPMIILEAGRCSVPVVAAQIGGIPEIIGDNETGRLFPPENVEALSATLCELLSAPAERLRLGESLRKRVETDFSLDSVLAGYLSLGGKSP